jgi:hypothetical protein
MQRGTRNQARIGSVDMRMTTAFHARDVCVGEHKNPWDISRNAATTSWRVRRAGAGCAAFARQKQRQTTVVNARKITPRLMNA